MRPVDSDDPAAPSTPSIVVAPSTVVTPSTVETASRRLTARLERPPSCLDWADLPTPVEPAPWLEGRSAVACFIKRDDLSSQIYGGGKVRKLEWQLASPPFSDPRPVVSIGGIGSHSLLSLALFLRQQDRTLHALVFDQVLTHHARLNLAVLASLGTKFWSTHTRAGIAFSQLAYHTWSRPTPRGIAVAAGASSPLGSLGFVEAGLELAAQIADGHCPRPDRIYLTAGSAGSAAGLALGLALARVPTTLRLVSAVEPLLFNRWLYRLKLAAVYSELKRRGLRGDAPPSATALLASAGLRWSIDHSQVGRGYAVPTPQSQATVDQAATHDIALENTYTGKCMAALQRDLAQRLVPQGHTILFWHTHARTNLTPHIHPNWQTNLPKRLQRLVTTPPNSQLPPVHS